MLRKRRREVSQLDSIHFCESCDEVCTTACHAEAERERVLSSALVRAIHPR